MTVVADAGSLLAPAKVCVDAKTLFRHWRNQ